jgi:hypothetical protein
MPQESYNGEKLMQVFILTVNNEDSGCVDTSVHTTHEKAIAYLGDYCRLAWEEQKHGTKLSKKDNFAIKRFFEFWNEEMSFSIEEQTIDPVIVSDELFGFLRFAVNEKDAKTFGNAYEVMEAMTYESLAEIVTDNKIRRKIYEELRTIVEKRGYYHPLPCIHNI